VERTFAWITRNRRMICDCEFLAETTEALVYVCMIRLMLQRLTKGSARWTLRHPLEGVLQTRNRGEIVSCRPRQPAQHEPYRSALSDLKTRSGTRLSPGQASYRRPVILGGPRFCGRRHEATMEFLKPLINGPRRHP